MTAVTTNNASRVNRNAVFSLDVAGALPADAKVSTITTYLQGTDTNRILLLSPLDINPSTTNTEYDIEGNADVAEVTLENYEIMAIGQTPEQMDAIITKYDGVRCDVKVLFCDPDDTVNKTTNVVTPVVGDIIAVIRNVLVRFQKPIQTGTEMKMKGVFSKKVAGNKQLVAYMKTIIANT
jgi:hypothetical protein